MSGKVIAARLAATQLLHGVLFDRRLMAEILNRKGNPIERLNPADRARAQSLANGVLRHLGRIDAVLYTYLKKPPQPRALQALRLATYEILAEGTAAHGAVNAAVEIVRGSAKAGHLTGLVNAVLRKVADEGAAIWKDQAAQALPSWLAKPLTKNFGNEALRQIEVAHQVGARIDITLKDQGSAKQYVDELEAELLPTGSLRLPGRPQVTALPGFDQGDWWVQDAAAALPVKLLGDVKGLRVLDLCAAPGGKTMQLAAGGAKVTALDISAARLERVAENLDRVGLKAALVEADAIKYVADQTFDAVVLDAPCSATGTIRRHPDLPFAKAGVDFSGLFALQATLIDAALGFLKPGGRLVYCTCSLLPREGETQVVQALERHRNVTISKIDAGALGVDAEWQTGDGGLRLRPDYWPGRGGMDGFYMALLEKSQVN